MPVSMTGFKDGRYLVKGEGKPRFFDSASEARKAVRARRAAVRRGRIGTDKGRKLSQKSLDRR